MPGLAEREFAGDPRSPAAARAFAKDNLGAVLGLRIAPPVLCDDVELVVSELVTNAVRAGSPTVRVTLEDADGQLRVSVTDFTGGWPEQREAGVQDTGGRGLPLVSAISASWGVRLVADGKTVWADIVVPTDPG